MDVWTMILLRVPTVNLVKFKFVCKAWHGLISSRQFAQRHLEHWTSGPIDGLLLCTEYRLGFDCWKKGIIYFSDLNHKDDDSFTCRCYNLPINRCPVEAVRSKELRVLASCDGLTLICYAEQTHCQLFTCNPSMGSYRMLPVFRPMHFRHFELWAITGLYEWAMVRNASTGQLKIFGMQKLNYSNRRCYALELQGGGCEVQLEPEWKELQVPMLSENNWSIEASTTKDSKVYWLAIAMHDRLTHHSTALLSTDIYEVEFVISYFSVRLSPVAGHYFASKGKFYCIEQVGQYHLRLSTLNTKEWTECRNLLPFPFDLHYLSITEHAAILGDTKLVMCFDNQIYMLDMVSKKFGGLQLDSKHFLFRGARKLVPHISSVAGCM